jgi:site-specific recombinase XerD
MLPQYRNYLLSAGLGEGTARLYVGRIEQLQRFHPDLSKVTHDDLTAYLGARRSLAANTRKSMRSAFRSFFGWGHEFGYFERDAAYRLKPITVPWTLPRVAGDDVVQMGLLTADDHMTAMILLGRYGCLRLTELTTLHSRQREHDLLRILGKGQKQRLVPANDELLHALLTLERIQGPGYYFPGRTGPHLHPQAVTKMISRHLGTNPHSLRHAGATAAYEATHDLEAVRQLLGHSSIATTQRYLHVGMDAVRRAAAGTTMTSRISSFPPTTLPMGEPAVGRHWAA